MDITILGLEASQTTESLDRLLRVGYVNGVRFIDSADCYASSERKIADWLRIHPELRKTIVLSTKDHPAGPSQLGTMFHRRLAAFEVDSVDLFFIHSLGNRHSVAEAIAFVTGRELKEAVEAIKKSGKARLVGFSTQHQERARIIEAAAREGFVDVMMLQYTAWPRLDDSLNRALDLASRRGIGLIAMKPSAGIDSATFQAEASRRMPGFKVRGLSPFQGLLHSIWSDERISCCSLSMRTTDQIRACAEAARKF